MGDVPVSVLVVGDHHWQSLARQKYRQLAVKERSNVSLHDSLATIGTVLGLWMWLGNYGDSWKRR